jgi:2-methylcitrate dehydratase
MGICEQLASYVWRASWDTISPEARGKMRQHILDSLGCAIGALSTGVASQFAGEETELRGSGPCSFIAGGKATPERAAFHNALLVQALQCGDVFMAAGDICQPSDTLAGLLAAAELASASGREFLSALTVAYHVYCRLAASGVPAAGKGFSPSIQLALSLACGISRVLGLTEHQTAHAVALCAASGLTVTGAKNGSSAESRGLTSANMAFQSIHYVRLAQKGIQGCLDIFEGHRGIEHLLGKPFGIDWENETYDAILACSMRRYSADFHAQSVIEAILELRGEHQFTAADVQGLQVDIFQAAYERMGGTQKPVRTRQDAERSLPYLMSVALLDGEVGPQQFDSRRIQSEDVQSLLRNVTVWLSQAYTTRYPDNLHCKVRAGLKDGRIFETEKSDYPGFFRRPAPVEQLIEKFKQLGRLSASDRSVQNVIEAVARLEQRPVTELCGALREIRPETAISSGSAAA